MVSILKAGFYTSIQDLGRFDYLDQGVPISGVMDSYAAKLANALLNNDLSDAVLEFTMVGPKLKFHCNSFIAITGASCAPEINNIKVKLNVVIAIKENDVLSFGPCKYGFRGYLAVKSGFKSELILGSRSMYTSITSKPKLSDGDQVKINEHSNLNLANKMAIVKTQNSHFTSSVISVYKGPEYDLLSKTLKKKINSEKFVIGKAHNRMAYKLDTVQLRNKLEPIITSIVLPGTVQLTPAGQLIILMRDCQTTGGYPRIFQLTEMAISQISQKFNNDSFIFSLQTY